MNNNTTKQMKKPAHHERIATVVSVISNHLVMTALTVLAFWRHRANIVRLSKGTESKVFLSKSKTKKG